jgi:hypothetical protein
MLGSGLIVVSNVLTACSQLQLPCSWLASKLNFGQTKQRRRDTEKAKRSIFGVGHAARKSATK